MFNWDLLYKINNIEILIERTRIMRKLFTGLLFAVALPASASVTSDIEAGELSASDIINNAVSACGGDASCQEAVIADAVAAGIDITSVINLAIAAGVEPLTAVTVATRAGLDAGQSEASIAESVANSNGVGNALTATAGGQAGGINVAPSNNTPTPPPLTTTTIVETGEGLITEPTEPPTGPTPGFPDGISRAN